MKFALTPQYVLLGVGGLVLAGALIATFSGGCTTITDKRPVSGSHGYRVYTNEIYKAFDHSGRLVCVPEGWVPVGALSVTEDGAQFEAGKTGILIKQDAFAGRTIRPDGSSYEVTVLYPLATQKEDVTRYLSVISESFSSVAALYDDVPKENRTAHTVLVTVGIAGNARDETTRVYPDPTALVSSFTLPPATNRAEGLIIHAVVHLYNRFAVGSGYASLQPPFSREEFEELEATWAEVGLSERSDAAFERLMYLYKVHSAVVTQNPSLATEPPFNNREEFLKIVPTVFVPDSGTYLDHQYGHYVLLPLTMAAVDALLYEHQTGTTVERLLKDIHRGKRGNLFTELSRLLPEKDYKNVEYWLKGDAQVPVALIESAIKNVYSR